MMSRIGDTGRWVKRIATPTSVNPSDISGLRAQRFGITSVQEAEEYQERTVSIVEKLQNQKLMSDAVAYTLIAVAVVISIVGISLGVWLWEIGNGWMS